MANKYVDLLLVETVTGDIKVVYAPTYKADVGNLVRFDGTIGEVVQKAWTEQDGDVWNLVSAVVPVYEAEEVLYTLWKKEEGEENATDPGSS